MIKGNATSEVKNVLKYDQLEVLSINSTHEVTHAVLKYIFFACTLYRTIDFRLSYTNLRLSFAIEVGPISEARLKTCLSPLDEFSVARKSD